MDSYTGFAFNLVYLRCLAWACFAKRLPISEERKAPRQKSKRTIIIELVFQIAIKMAFKSRARTA